MHSKQDFVLKSYITGYDKTFTSIELNHFMLVWSFAVFQIFIIAFQDDTFHERYNLDVYYFIVP